MRGVSADRLHGSGEPGELPDVPEKIWWLPSGGLDTASVLFCEGSFVVWLQMIFPRSFEGDFFFFSVGEEVLRRFKRATIQQKARGSF